MGSTVKKVDAIGSTIVGRMMVGLYSLGGESGQWGLSSSIPMVDYCTVYSVTVK